MLESLLEWDRNALIWVNSHHSPIADAILVPVSWAGEAGVLPAIVCALMLVYGDARVRRAALVLIIALLLAEAVTQILSLLVQRPRPYAEVEGIRQVGIRWPHGSFPSGHAHSATILAIIVGVRWRRLLVPLVIVAALSCYSRVYVGMHYPLDIVAGIALGVASTAVVLAAEEMWDRLKTR